MLVPAPSYPLRAALAAIALTALAAADAGEVAVDVGVKVQLVTSSGACGVQDRPADLGVSCAHVGGPLIPPPGAVAYERVGTIEAPSVAAEPLPLYSDGVKIASWRVVKLDNSEYLELTVAW